MAEKIYEDVSETVWNTCTDHGRRMRLPPGLTPAMGTRGVTADPWWPHTHRTSRSVMGSVSNLKSTEWGPHKVSGGDIAHASKTPPDSQLCWRE